MGLQPSQTAHCRLCRRSREIQEFSYLNRHLRIRHEGIKRTVPLPRRARRADVRLACGHTAEIVITLASLWAISRRIGSSQQRQGFLKDTLAELGGNPLPVPRGNGRQWLPVSVPWY